MNKPLDEFSDRLMKEKGKEYYLFTKAHLNLNDFSSMRSLATKYQGNYIGEYNEFNKKQCFSFHNRKKAIDFTRDCFMQFSLKDNQFIPFSNLVIRKEKNYNNAYHITNYNGIDGQNPVLAYKDKNGLRTPYLLDKDKVQIPQDVKGHWYTREPAKSSQVCHTFVFDSCADFARFAIGKNQEMLYGLDNIYNNRADDFSKNQMVSIDNPPSNDPAIEQNINIQEITSQQTQTTQTQSQPVQPAQTQPVQPNLSNQSQSQTTTTAPTSQQQTQTTQTQSQPVQPVQTQPVQLNLFNQSQSQTTTTAPTSQQQTQTTQTQSQPVQPKNKNEWTFEEHDGVEKNRLGTASATDKNVAIVNVLADIIEQKRDATPDEKDILATYSGWGNDSVAKALDYSDDENIDDVLHSLPNHQDEIRARGLIDNINRISKALSAYDDEELKNLGLQDRPTEKQLRQSIVLSSDTAFYTPRKYTEAIYSALDRLGFKGGTILEPSAGTGDMISSMSREMLSKSTITAVEKDPVSGLINHYLHPDIDLRIGRFQEQKFGKDNSQKFDLTITNCPFDKMTVADSSLPRELQAATKSLHTYFPVKMMEQTNPGGIMAIIATHGLLDSPANEDTRKILADQGEFIGVVRLPNNAFDATSVNADVILMRKYNTNEAHKEQQEFVHSTQRTFDYGDNKQYVSAINDSFFANLNSSKALIIGHWEDLNTQYGMTRGVGSVYSNKDEIGSVLRGILGVQTQDYLQERNGAQLNIEHQQSQSPAPKKTLSDAEQKLNEIAETLDKLCVASLSEDKVNEQNNLRAQLNKNYDSFVQQYGYISNNSRSLAGNENYLKVSALENVEGNNVTKADIFFKNTIHPEPRAALSNDAQDVINFSYVKTNRIDEDIMRDNLGDDWVKICNDLIYLNPQSMQYEPKAYYLSGDVKTRLEQAQKAAETDDRFKKNVDALVAVQPKDLKFQDIAINFGVNFVPVEYYEEYLKEDVIKPRRKEDFKLNYLGSGCPNPYEITDWKMKFERPDLEIGQGRNATNAKKIIDAALNNKVISVKMKVRGGDGKEITVPDQTATDMANDKVRQIREGFSDWLCQSQNVDKVKVIEDNYNRLFNRTVETQFSQNFVDPVGCTVNLRPHQKEALARCLTGNDTYIDHAPGLGKTLVMITSIMEQKRLGMISKPLLLCMKANIRQVANEFQRAYPNAKLLVPSEKDFSAKNRNALLEKIKTNSYDCVILTHDNYAMLNHDKHIIDKVADEYAEDYRNVFDSIDRQLKGMNQYASGYSELEKRKNTIASQKEKFENDIKKSTDKITDPNAVTFEDCGFDYMCVDEAHEFKNLKYVTGMQHVAGLGSAGGSGRALNLLLGVRSIQERRGGDKGVAFFSGTPVTNSIVELFNIEKFLTPSKLKERNEKSFDAWASRCAVTSQDFELDASVSPKQVWRVRAYVNTKEIQSEYRQFADVKDNDNAHIDIPTSQDIKIAVHADDNDKKFLQEISRISNSGHSTLLGVDLNQSQLSAKAILAITKAKSLSVSSEMLVDPEVARSAETKVDVVADKVAEIYHDTKDQKGTQFIFCDIVGDSKEEKNRPYSVYGDLINQLVAKGVNKNEILNVREIKNDEKRKEAFAKLDAGEYRIAIGATKNLGTGINAQTHCCAVHNVDVPWKPSDMDQRNARGVRQGNEWAKNFNNNNIPVYYYIKERSIDAKMYDLLYRKNQFINQLRKDPNLPRQTQGTFSLNNQELAQILSIAYGNRYFQDNITLSKEIADLERQKRTYDKGKSSLLANFNYASNYCKSLEADVQELQAEKTYISKYGSWDFDKKKEKEGEPVIVDGVPMDNEPKKVGEKILESIKNKNTCEVEAFGYVFNVFTPLRDKSLHEMRINHYSDRKLSEGIDNCNARKFYDTDMYVNISSDPTSVGLSMRRLINKFNDKLSGAQSLLDVNSALKDRIENELKKIPDFFPKEDELKAKKEEFKFVSSVMNGSVEIDEKLVQRLSDEWDEKNNKIDYSSIRLGVKGDNPVSNSYCSAFIERNDEQLFNKFIAISEGISEIIAAKSNTEVPERTFHFAIGDKMEYGDVKAKIAGPLVLSDARLKPLFTPLKEYGVSDKQIEKMADEFGRKNLGYFMNGCLQKKDESFKINIINANNPYIMTRLNDPRDVVSTQSKAFDCAISVPAKYFSLEIATGSTFQNRGNVKFNLLTVNDSVSNVLANLKEDIREGLQNETAKDDIWMKQFRAKQSVNALGADPIEAIEKLRFSNDLLINGLPVKDGTNPNLLPTKQNYQIEYKNEDKLRDGLKYWKDVNLVEVSDVEIQRELTTQNKPFNFDLVVEEANKYGHRDEYLKHDFAHSDLHMNLAITEGMDLLDINREGKGFSWAFKGEKYASDACVSNLLNDDLAKKYPYPTIERLSAEDAGRLRVMRIEDMLAIPTPDDRIHLLEIGEKDSKNHTFVPDPYYYAASADRPYENETCKAIAIDKLDLRIDLMDKLYDDVYNHDLYQGNLINHLLSNNISFSVRPLNNEDFTHRQRLINYSQSFINNNQTNFSFTFNFDNPQKDAYFKCPSFSKIDSKSNENDIIDISHLATLNIYADNNKKKMLALPAFAPIKNKDLILCGSVKCDYHLDSSIGFSRYYVSAPKKSYDDAMKLNDAKLAVSSKEDNKNNIIGYLRYNQYNTGDSTYTNLNGIHISKADIDNLNKYSVTGKTCEIDDFHYNKKPCILFISQKTGDLSVCDPSKVEIDKELSLEAQQINDLRAGKCVSAHYKGEIRNLMIDPNSEKVVAVQSAPVFEQEKKKNEKVYQDFSKNDISEDKEGFKPKM